MERKHLAPGSRISKWRVVVLLGEGAFGAVYHVQDAAGNSYALKVEPIANETPKVRLFLSNSH